MPTTTEFAQLAQDCISKHTILWNRTIPSEPFLEAVHGLYNVTNEDEWFDMMRQVDTDDGFSIQIDKAIRREYFANDFVHHNPDLLTYINSLSDNDKTAYFARCEALVPEPETVAVFSEPDDAVIDTNSHDRDEYLMEIYKHDEVAYRMSQRFASM